MSAWFSRLTLKREDAAVAPLLRDLAPAETGAAMDMGHRLMWTAATQETRAASGPNHAAFLWREIEPGRKFFLLGPRPVESSPYFEIESKPFEPSFRPGDALAFDLRVNATVAHKLGGEPQPKRLDIAMVRLLKDEAAGADRTARAERRQKAAEDAARDWLARIGARDGFVLKAVRLDAYRVEALPRRGRNAKLGVSDLSGLLEVTDGEALRARVLAGFGRAKAFGCGLMLLRRVL